ncbi:MAG: 3'-5' exonuclease [Candidatus Methylacidiphilales bacterium]|nr:3'-5' exonuclease [Candidatus Methylacidiphilales bacterium]
MTQPEPQNAITKEELASLPLFRYEGPIHLIRSDEELARHIPDLRKEKVIGFDTETRPSFRRGQSYLPTVIQMATADAAYIIQLAEIQSTGLINVILSSPDILKTGIALDQDLVKLKERFPLAERSILDLGKIAARQKIAKTGLRNLAGLLLGYRISKQSQVTNWAAAELTPSQIQYAATDAWISRELFFALEQRFPEALREAIEEAVKTLPRYLDHA